jgi:threonine aldolase
MQELRDVAKANNLAVHLDGARVFNAALAIGVEASAIVAYCDSVMFCLSKGLSAPIGSMLAGTTAFIREARRVRKRLGGGMRQLGVLAAAGIVALEEMIDRLAIDHRHARMLAGGLAQLPGYQIDLETVQTNMVYVNVEGLGLTAKEFAEKLRQLNITVSIRPPYMVRFVTHRHITEEHIVMVLEVAGKIAEEHLTPER